MTKLEIALKPNRRYTFVGKTRSGKTFFCWHLLHLFMQRNKDLQIIKIDPKFEHTKFGKGESLEAPKLVTKYDKKARVQIFQTFTWTDELERMVDSVLKRGNVIVVLDELGGIANSITVPTGITRLWTQGGGKGVGAMACIQRPSRVPQVIMTQTEVFAVFRINSLIDRKTLMNFIPDTQILERRIPLKYFFLFEDALDKAALCKPLVIPTTRTIK